MEYFLRLFGLFWILGGIFTIRQGFMNNFIDQALEQITQEKEDKMDTYFVLTCGFLTVINGIGLFLAYKFVTISLILLVVVQVAIFQFKERKFSQAKSAEEKENYTIQSSTKNAFTVSWVITLLSLFLWIS